MLYGESDGSDPGSVLDSVLGNPLLGNNYKGAEAVLLHIAAGSEFAMSDCHEVLSALKYDLAEDANLIWGLRTDDSMSTKVKVVMLVSAIPDSEHDLSTDVDEELNSLGSSLPMIN